jgi:SAM-dependent methyltransferase
MRLGTDWYANRDFWRIYAPYIFGRDRWAGSSAEAEAVIALTSPPPGGRVLDACCGVGRHSLEFARRGFAVTGVDLNPDYLDAAQNSAAAESLDIQFLRQDILELTIPSAFDLIINMYISFGYFDKEDDNVRFLRSLRTHLAAGGKLLVETLGKEQTARNFKENEWYEENGVFVLARYAVTDDWSRLKNRWIIIDGDSRHDYTFSQRLYSAAEAKELFRLAGFSDAAVYGSLRGTPYDHEAESLVILGKV